ncbi:uncharacterized protein LOC114270507 isoform X3 [Camellia sinensis]|uniref:uncharacterized protein LOC114270507 isoform X3 n=1 Tax=Camellia sinensis TaxID=4442 RepID=UPI0010367D4A|nr:uncharacterized protein LOC114270507 isoform X3 [Camellia sinensis]
MLITERSVISNILTHMVVKKNGTKFRSSTVVSQKRELGEKSRDKQEPIFPLRVSNTILAQSTITVLGLGFIDAGYRWYATSKDIVWEVRGRKTFL